MKILKHSIKKNSLTLFSIGIKILVLPIFLEIFKDFSGKNQYFSALRIV